jgi:tRNA U34 2-thiouridine synthase MnmA/TrmU
MNEDAARRYVRIAEHDYRVVGLLLAACSGQKNSEDVTDWQVALLFYILCLQVKALAVCRGKELQDHYAVKQWLNVQTELCGVARSYRKIEEWSRDARYEGRRFNPCELSRFAQWFSEVHCCLSALLKKEGVEPSSLIDVTAVF